MVETVIPYEAQYAWSYLYVAACIIGAFSVAYEWKRRNRAMIPGLIVISSCLVFGIIGTRVLPILLEWLHITGAGGKSSLGGIAGVVVGTILAKKLLGLRIPVTTTFVPGWLILLAIARVGCFLAGCCYGEPTNIFCSVEYSAGSPAYHAHIASGLISTNAAASLGVHPVQLYEAAFLLCLAILTPRVRKFSGNENIFPFTIICYSVFRFFIEFIRSNVLLHGLSSTQWILRFIIPLLTVYLFFKNKRTSGTINEEQVLFKIRYSLPYACVIIVSLFVLSLSQWFSRVESITLHVILLPLIFFTVTNKYALPIRRRAQFGAVFLLCGLILMTGADSLNTVKPGGSRAYTTFGASGTAGSYKEMQENCSGQTVRTDVYNYSGGGLEIERTGVTDSIKFTFGANAFYNSMTSKTTFAEGYTDTSGEYNILKGATYLGVSPYVRMDWSWVGLGLGAHFINATFDKPDSNYYGDAEDGNHFLPNGYLRIGPYRSFFIDASYANNFPANGARPYIQGGIGSGLGEIDGPSIRIGGCEDGLYIDPEFVFKNGFIIDPFIVIGDGTQFTLRLKYRLNAAKKIITDSLKVPQ